MTKSEKQPRIAKTISRPKLKPFHRESCGGWDFPFKMPICSLPVCVRESVADKVTLRGCFVCWILEFLTSATAPRVTPFFLKEKNKTALDEITESSSRFQCIIAEAVGRNEAETKFRLLG